MRAAKLHERPGAARVVLDSVGIFRDCYTFKSYIYNHRLNKIEGTNEVW